MKATTIVIAAALALGLAVNAGAQSTFSSAANPYRSAAGLGGGLHFSSPAAATMNTLFMRGSHKDQVEAVKRESAARRAGQAAASAPAVGNFTPVRDEQAVVLQGLVGAVPAGPRRDALRTRLLAVSEIVERTPGWQRGNIASVTSTLAALSYTKATGRALTPEFATELVHGIDEALLHDAAFQEKGARERSRIDDLYTATIGLTLQLSLSKDPAEVAQGRAIARNTLHELGIQP